MSKINIVKIKEKLFGSQVLNDSPRIHIYFQHNAIHYDDKSSGVSYYTNKFDTNNHTNKKYQVLSVKWKILNKYECHRLNNKWDKYIKDTTKHFKRDVFEELVKKVWHPSRFHIWSNYDVDLE